MTDKPWKSFISVPPLRPSSSTRVKFYTHQIDTGIIFDMAQINLDRVNLVCKKIDTGIILYPAEINSRSSIWCVKKLTRLNFNCSRVKNIYLCQFGV